MATFRDQRPQTQPVVKAPDRAAEQTADRGPAATIGGLEEGLDISTEASSRLQFQLGNAAIQDLLPRPGQAGLGSGLRDGLQAVDQGEEQVEDVIELEEVGESSLELEAPQHGGDAPPTGGDGDGGGGGNDPWELGKLFGGDDEPEDGAAAKPRRRARPNRLDLPIDAVDPFADALPVETKVDPSHLGAIEAGLGTIELEGDRHGDACYLAVEAVLGQSRRLAIADFDPEALVGRARVDDPLGRATTIGRFLMEAGVGRMAVSVSRVLALAGASLVSTSSGYAGAVARLASLAVCAEALEGGSERTDRLVRVALSGDVWDRTVTVARGVARTGRLFAPEIADGVLGPSVSVRARGAGALVPSALGARAIERLVPTLRDLTFVDLTFPDAQLEPADATMDEADRVLAEMTGGDTAEATLEDHATAAISDTLRAATELLNLVGRAQVEVASAAVAVRQVCTDAPVRQTLVHADHALRSLARAVLQHGRALEAVKDLSLEEQSSVHASAVVAFRAAANALQSVRIWAFAEIAGGVGPQ